ncbi:MAG: hypothetical protein ACJAY7_001822 [Pseudohongiellaceae bacterium]|jgi:hypothetical protein
MVITKRQKLIIISVIPALALILWEYSNGEVATHYFGADSSNPGLSNWWGLVTIPILTWLALGLIEKRTAKEARDREASNNITLEKNHFVGGLVFGLTAALLWELGQQEYLPYVMLSPWVLSLFLRIYLPETTMGFVLAMMVTFGAVLPIVFSVVIQTIGFVIYLIFNRGGKRLLKKLT